MLYREGLVPTLCELCQQGVFQNIRSAKKQLATCLPKRLNGMMRAKLEEGIEQGLEKGRSEERTDMVLKMSRKV